ncbi:DUF3084 domain-containing protein [Deinococcus peraridilitoris]|uniref:HAMP domain-containing protein n=1 Tax=Deinococcus peraridilitoris (strain DSM 19664 / LMG 22246 / CIP 109416 / KR-200) TaxID=937777 RepID=K9ZVS5_DEIPD|nr:DUF3084 domain-containing protein [Deinococcus peraridilitoris]AFZ65723.1 Protein of unknown function (DUF3084) [Deinococcus peraridilitoris DSM 19664]
MFLLFLGFVVLLSGFVAYAADTIARRVGRRHLRLFGLRPKTTALIVAVLSGMGISFASVLAFGILNRQALRNVAQADEMRVEIRVLRDELEPLRASIDETRDQLDHVRGQAAALERSRDAAIKARDEASEQAQALGRERAAALKERDEAVLQADTAAARTRALEQRVSQLAKRRDELALKAQEAEAALAENRQEVEALAGQLQNLEQTRATLETQATEAQRREREARAQEAQAKLQEEGARKREAEARSREAEAQRREAQRREAQAQREARLAQQDARAAAQQASELETKLTTLQSQLNAVQTQTRLLAQQSQALIAERDRLRKERDKAQQDVRAEQARRDAIVRDNEMLQRSLQAAQTERARLAGDVARATSELSATRTGDLLYEKGDLVHMQTVASVHNIPEAISGAQAKAAARGARGRPPATLSESAHTRLQARVRGLNYSAVIVFRSATNAVQGFPVELTAEAFANRTLYRRDEVIRSASLRLGSPDQMREQLLELVTQALLDLQERGVPPENIASGGLNPVDTVSFLGNLKGTGTVRVGVASRTEVRPGGEVELYPVLR